MFTLKFIKIFHSVQEIGLFSLFQNLALGKASTNNKCHFAISWTRCRQYQCECKILSKYSKRFKSYMYRHFSRTGQWQNLHKLSGDKIKCLIIGHTMKVNLQFQLTFLGSCNFINFSLDLICLQTQSGDYTSYACINGWNGTYVYQKMGSVFIFIQYRTTI